MHAPRRLPRRFRLGWAAAVDRPFLSFLVLSLVVHAAVVAEARSRLPAPAPSPAAPVVTFVFVGSAGVLTPIDPVDRGVHEVLGTLAAGGAGAGDLLHDGGLDEDLDHVLARVRGVRLPRPGETGVLRVPRPYLEPLTCAMRRTPSGELLCGCR